MGRCFRRPPPSTFRSTPTRRPARMWVRDFYWFFCFTYGLINTNTGNHVPRTGGVLRPARAVHEPQSRGRGQDQLHPAVHFALLLPGYLCVQRGKSTRDSLFIFNPLLSCSWRKARSMRGSIPSRAALFSGCSSDRSCSRSALYSNCWNSVALRIEKLNLKLINSMC